MAAPGLLARATFVPVAMALVGCLAETPVAPGPAAAIDQRLLGKWRCVSGDEEEPSILTLARLSATSYSGTTAAPEEAPTPFEGFPVAAGDDTVINVRDPETGSALRWTVARVVLYRPDLLHVGLLDVEQYRAHSREIGAAFRDPVRREALFQDAFTCVRVRSRP